MRRIFMGHTWKWGFWFRIFGFGLHVQWNRDYKPLFSERNGMRRASYIGPIRIEIFT